MVSSQQKRMQKFQSRTGSVPPANAVPTSKSIELKDHAYRQRVFQVSTSPEVMSATGNRQEAGQKTEEDVAAEGTSRPVRQRVFQVSTSPEVMTVHP